MPLTTCNQKEFLIESKLNGFCGVFLLHLILPGSSAAVNYSILSSTMEAVCSRRSKGIFSLGDSDVLFQILKDHKLVPASRKSPKCEITINNIYFFRC